MILSADNLRVTFHTRDGVVRAVDGVSFELAKGETLGIVGESGSGKSVLSASMLRLLPMPPARIEGGRVRFGGLDLTRCGMDELRRVRGRGIAMIFQDPMTALNPYLRVLDQLIEPLLIHRLVGHAEARQKALKALIEVGIPDPEQRLQAYPHQLSGGMRQRVAIAMALIARPEVVIADEPTTALDVTVQAQVLDLLKKRQQAEGIAVILISHDLGVIAGSCDRVLVMYAGRIVESGPVREIFYHPRHPYTLALRRARPSLSAVGNELTPIPGQPPDLASLPIGCAFAPRCGFASPDCALEQPGASSEELHATACIRVARRELDLERPVP